MAYTQFSSQNADYVLDLGNHFHNRRHNHVFDGINALILESGDIPPNQILNNNSSLGNRKLIDYCQENEIPIYFADFSITPSAVIREIMGGFLELPIMPVALYYAFSKKRVNWVLSRLYSDYTYLLQNPIVEGKNAIVARKIEEQLVPELQSKLRKRPKVGIHHGAKHFGLREDIQSKRRRDFTIWNYRKFNFARYASFASDSMSKSYLCEHDGTRWIIQEINGDLF